jgi:WD40 repeat protein
MIARVLLCCVLGLGLTVAVEPAEPPRLDADGAPLPEHALFRLGTLKLRHTEDVTAVAFSADGKSVVSVGKNLETRFWETTTGKELLFSTREESPCRCVTLSGDGRWMVAVIGESWTLRDLATGKTLHTLTEHKNRLEDAVFSADGKWLVTGASDGTACVWDVATGKVVQTFAHDSGPSDVRVALTPSGRVLAYGDFWSITVVPPGAGKTTPTVLLPQANAPLTALALSPDGKTVAAIHGRNLPTLRVWDVGSGKLQKESPLTERMGGELAFACDGSFYLVECGEKESVIRSPFTGQPVCRLAGPVSVRTLAFSADGKRLVTASGLGVRLWDTSTGKELISTSGFDPASPLTEVCYSVDGRWLVTGAENHNSARIWEAQSGKLLRGLCWDPGTWVDRPTLAVSSVKDGVLEVRDGSTDRVLMRQQCPDESRRLYPLTPGSKTVALVRKQPGAKPLAWEVFCHDPTTGKTQVYRTPGRPDNEKGTHPIPLYCGTDPDNKTLVLLSQDRGEAVLHFWDVASGRLKSSVEVSGWNGEDRARFHNGFVLRGRYFRLVSIDRRGLPSLWCDVERGALQPGQSEAWAAFGFHFGATSPDGRLEALFQPDTNNRRLVVLCDVETERIVEFLRLPSGSAGPMAFSPDGKLLAAGGDADIHLFAVKSGEHLGTLTGHRGTVRGLSFSPDGTRLASCATDTSTLVWDLAPFRKKLPGD